MMSLLPLILAAGLLGATNLQARTPPPQEENGPCADFTYAQDASPSSELLKLWYAQPATDWTEALPIGNGRLGAMVYGGIEREHLQLNEDTLWSGGPHCYDNPEAYGHLATVRELLERGEYAKAEATAEKMLGIPKYQQAYMPLGDLFLDFPKGKEPSDYRRELDLENAVSTVIYRIGETRFTRQVFASHPDQAIVIRIECDTPGRITFELSMTSPHDFQSRRAADDMLRMTGRVGPRTGEGASGARRLIGPWEGEGMEFAAQVKVEADGGTVAVQADKISVRDADAVTGDNSTFNNETEYPIILESTASGNTVVSLGPVTNRGMNNKVTADE